MDSLTYALGLRGALRWLGEAGRGSGVGPSTPGQAAMGAQGEGMTYVIAVGPVCPDPPRWAQTMESRAQACPVGTHSTTREGFPGRRLHRTGGIDLGHPEQGPGGWVHSGGGACTLH